MKIEIENKLYSNATWIIVKNETTEAYTIVEKLYLKILSKTLIGHSIKIITIAPQEYSLGYDFEFFDRITVKSKNFLISTIPYCDVELLKKIVLSEEFRRTLIIIVKTSSDLSDSQLNDIVHLVKSSSAILLNEVIFCEDDGWSLCLCNSDIDERELISISKELASNVLVN